VETGTRGEGGDRTLEIDARPRTRVRRARALHDAGARFTVVSEERGTVDFGGDGDARDRRPDRRLAQRQARAAHHALSIAVAEGRRWPTSSSASSRPRAGEEWVAERGAGAQLDGDAAGPDARRAPHARRQARAVGVESADPRWVRESADALVAGATGCARSARSRSRSARSPAARLDGMATLRAAAPSTPPPAS
jgi:myo-inositol-1(or 4)-monophosphatase